VQRVIELGHDELPLDAASRLCNSELLAKGAQAAAPSAAIGWRAPPAPAPPRTRRS